MTAREEDRRELPHDKGATTGGRIRRWIGLFGKSLAVMALSWVISQPATERLLQSLIIALVLGMVGEPFATFFL